MHKAGIFEPIVTASGIKKRLRARRRISASKMLSSDLRPRLCLLTTSAFHKAGRIFGTSSSFQDREALTLSSVNTLSNLRS